MPYKYLKYFSDDSYAKRLHPVTVPLDWKQNLRLKRIVKHTFTEIILYRKERYLTITKTLVFFTFVKKLKLSIERNFGYTYIDDRWVADLVREFKSFRRLPNE